MKKSQALNYTNSLLISLQVLARDRLLGAYQVNKHGIICLQTMIVCMYAYFVLPRLSCDRDPIHWIYTHTYICTCMYAYVCLLGAYPVNNEDTCIWTKSPHVVFLSNSSGMLDSCV